VAERRVFRFRRDLIRVSGPEAVSYLQGQVSQDVAGLGVGASAWSWVLQPAGKVDALVRVTRTGPDSLDVDVDEGYGELVLNRLARFKLRTKADIELVPGIKAVRPEVDKDVDPAWLRTPIGGLLVYAFRGPGAADGAAQLAGGDPTASFVPLWPEGGEEAADVTLGGREIKTLPQVEGPEAWEAARIAAGVPVMGAELTEKTIPGETGLVEQTVSFTKGCYTGQELVARIDSRGGNVPRRLRGLRSPSPLEVGAELNAGGKVVGTVTSAAVSPELGPIGLAYVGRAVEPGVTVDAGGTPVEVVELPIR
jgi:tRNA-modifying protein YgfZ